MMQLLQRGLAAGCAVINLWAGPAFAESDDWFARVWQTDDGLLDNNVRALTQTPDGFLWVATETGLMRFDGVRFQAESLPGSGFSQENSVERLLVDSRKRFWMAMDRGNFIAVGTNRVSEFSGHDGLPQSYPTALFEDKTGTVWIAFNNGFAVRIQDEVAHSFAIAETVAASNTYCRLTPDAAGQVWFSKDRFVGIFQAGEFQVRATLPRRVTRITTASGGGIWICAGAELLRCTDDGNLDRRAQLPEGAGPTVLLEDRAGVLWIGTAAHGLFRYEGGNFTNVRTSQQNISCLLEDAEGNLWVGTNGGGLIRLRPRTVRILGKNAGLPFESLRSACRDARGAFWVVTWSREAWRETATGWVNLTTLTNRPGGGNFSCVAADPAGPVWIGSRSGGLYRHQDGVFTQWNNQDGLLTNAIQSLMVGANGDLWVTTDASSGASGLDRLRGDQWHTFSTPDGRGVFRAIAEDEGGNVWIGAADGRLVRVTGDELFDETPNTPSPRVSIRCLATTGDGSLWIGYAGAGVGRLQAGHFGRVTAANGLGDDYISQMIADGRGWMWFGGNRGFFKVRQQELVDVADGRFARVRSIIYQRSEGVSGLQAAYESSPTGLRTADGELWLATRAGLAAIHADRIQDNPDSPRVQIERVLANGRPIAVYDALAAMRPSHDAGIADLCDSRAKLTLRPKHGKLDFEFTALSFTAPENVQFKYRLAPVDEDWVEAGPQRSASYPQLTAGDYRFQVIACNNSGVWNETGATLAFTVLPFVWQTWWFRAAAVAGFTLSVIAIVRFVSFRRLQRQLRLAEQQAALDKERARIARDLHDDLGGSLTQVALMLDMRQSAKPIQPDAEAPHAQKCASMVRQVVKSVDEIIWAINPRNDNVRHLVDYLSQFAVEFLHAADIRCRVDLPEQFPERAVSPEARHNLFLVVKEALNNVARHAHATEVRLGVVADEERVEISVADNGTGFERAPDNALSDGLRNQRQRMEEIGGEFVLESKPGAGTRVAFRYHWPHPK